MLDCMNQGSVRAWPSGTTMKQLLIGLFIGFGLLGCNDSNTVQPPRRAWVAMAPIQCLGNDWEQDWLAAHDDDYAGYPGDPDGRSGIITDYYGRQEVEVLEVVREPWGGGVCLACSCPAGFTLYLMIPEEDVPTMENLGFRVVDGPSNPD